jgi:hypothetical protein
MQRIHNAFSRALEDFAGEKNLPVGWPNTAFIPPLAPHLRPALRPEKPVVPCLGPGAYIRHGGIFGVDVTTVAGEGEADALSIAGDLLKAFRRGLDLGLDGLVVQQGGAAPGVVKDGRYTIAVSIPYYAYLQES